MRSWQRRSRKHGLDLHEGTLSLPQVPTVVPVGRSKYRAEPTIVDGIRFASKREAKYYQDLQLAKKSGELVYFLRQVPMHLPGNVKYLCDFVEFWKSGEVRFVDVKGFKTPMYRLKRKQVEALYPVKILEV